MFISADKLRALEARIAALETVPVSAPGSSSGGFAYVQTSEFLRALSFRFCTWDWGTPGHIVPLDQEPKKPL